MTENPSAAIALEVCMDDDIKTTSAEIYIVGTPGTYVTTPQDNPSYPTSTKTVLNYVRPAFNQATRDISRRLGLAGVYSTSHEGCGALGLQQVTGSAAVESVSREFIAAHSDCPPYLLHITHAAREVQPAGSSALGTIEITRPESDHQHHAKGVIYTTGGFITSLELSAVKTGSAPGAEYLLSAQENIASYPQLANFFIVSADWLVDAQKSGISPADLKTAVAFINHLTQSIMQGTLTHLVGKDQPLPQLAVVIFDAGRLGPAGRENSALLQSFIA